MKRKVWDIAFSTRALEGYEIRLHEHVERMIKTTYDRVEASKGTAEREVKKMFAGFAFDFMTDLVYGIGNYGMQDETGDSEYMVSTYSPSNR